MSHLSLFYRPQIKFVKVMFSQVSVCPQGGLAHCMLDTPPQADTPGQTPPWADTPEPPWADILQADTTRQTPPWAVTPCTVHAGIRSTSGWHASHWNAFLFFLCSGPWIACQSSPCNNNATCIDVNVDTFICACTTGYFGVTCTDSK